MEAWRAQAPLKKGSFMSATATQARDDRRAARAPFRRVLVGYVPTEQGADARALGIALARACESDLLLVSVVSALWLEHPGRHTGPAVVRDGDRDRAAAALREATVELAGGPGDAEVGRRLVASSSPARGLHDTAEAERADLIVVGSSHRGPVGRVLLGSVGERLLSGAPCAVALAPRGYAARAPRTLARITVAFDGSPEAQLALITAHHLAVRAGATVRAVMVLEPPPTTPGAFVPLPGLGPALPLAGAEPFLAIEQAEALERRERAARAALLAAVKALGDGAVVDHELIVEGDAPALILDAAQGADLLVLGSRSYGPVRRSLLGSVSIPVTREAPCPVLVTPRGELPRAQAATAGAPDQSSSAVSGWASLEQSR